MTDADFLDGLSIRDDKTQALSDFELTPVQQEFLDQLRGYRQKQKASFDKLFPAHRTATMRFSSTPLGRGSLIHSRLFQEAIDGAHLRIVAEQWRQSEAAVTEASKPLVTQLALRGM